LIFAEGVAAELKPYNIDVTAVAPGFAKTELSPAFNFDGLPINDKISCQEEQVNRKIETPLDQLFPSLQNGSSLPHLTTEMKVGGTHELQKRH